MPEGSGPLNVLLVEDDASIRRFVAMALEGEALRLVEAASLAEARARLRTEAFDVVVADLMLGDGSGMDLLRELAVRPTLTRVAFSAGLDRAARAQLADIGVTEVLSKPVSVSALQGAVARARTSARRAPVGGDAVDPVTAVSSMTFAADSAAREAASEAAPGATTEAATAAATEAAAIEHYFGGDRSLFVLYRQQCLAQFAEDLRHGDACAAAGRTLEMRHLAHSLKSVLSMLGDEGASARARALEDVAAGGEVQAAAGHWRALAMRLRAHRDGTA